jgi:phosphoribosylanthranilate isomerase
MKVKICGMTNQEDVSAAVALGVDALGFIFAKSPRRIDPEAVRILIRSLPPFVVSVGVFVNEAPAEIQAICAYCGLDMIQLHGDEPPELCEELMPRTIKAFQIKDESHLAEISAYRGKVRGVLFDSYAPEMRGGTGKTFDWSLAVKGKEMGIPVILSGGLNPDNIKDAISAVRPVGVDVNSGVEERPGKKDHGLMKNLMEIIRRSEL